MNFIEKIGNFVRVEIQKVLHFNYKEIISFGGDLIFLRFYKKQLPKVAFEFSFLSLSVIFLTALCTGAVLTMQTFSGLGAFASPSSVAKVVVPAIIRELGPVLTGLMIAGRIASSIASQIASMKAMDQINALTTLSINPVKYLVLPRVFSGMILMPILMIIANVIAIFGSFLVIVIKFNTTPAIYIESLIEFFAIKDLNVGLIKAVFFGGIITITGSVKGLLAIGTSEGVGIATTEAVVTSSILILFFNYILTLIFF